MQLDEESQDVDLVENSARQVGREEDGSRLELTMIGGCRGAGLLYLSSKISSETAMPGEELLYAFPWAAQPLESGPLLVRLRGSLIALIQLLDDSRGPDGKKGKGAQVILSGDGEPETLLCYITPVHERYLLVLALPVSMGILEAPISDLTESLLQYMRFFFGEDLTAAFLKKTKDVDSFLERFFLVVGQTSTPLFSQCPKIRALGKDRMLKVEDSLLLFESRLMPRVEGEGLKASNRALMPRPPIVLGTALLAHGDLVLSHLPPSLLQPIWQFCLLQKVNKVSVHQPCEVHWNAVFPDIPVLSGQISPCYYSILLVCEGHYLLTALLSSQCQFSGPPVELISSARTVLSSVMERLDSKGNNDTLTHAVPRGDFVMASADAFLETVKAKDEQGRSFQWFKSQMSPKSARRSSLGSQSAMDQRELRPALQLTSGGTNVALSFVLIDRSLGLCAMPQDCYQDGTLGQTVFCTFRRTCDKMRRCELVIGSTGCTEQSVTFSVHVEASKESGGSWRELSFCVVGRREGSVDCFVCHHLSCPQNMKEIMTRIAGHYFLQH